MNHSTSLALVDLYDIISLALDRKEFAAGVFVDLSKAFNAVNHNILKRQVTTLWGPRPRVGLGQKLFLSEMSVCRI